MASNTIFLKEQSHSTPLISSSSELQGTAQVENTQEAAAFTDSKAQALQHMSSLGKGQTTTEHQNVAAKGQSGENTGAQVVSADGNTQTQSANELTEDQKFGTTFNTGNKALDDLLIDFQNLRINVTTNTTEAKKTCDDLTENLHSFSTRFHNFADRAVNHLLNLLPSFKFVDKSINNIQDRQDDYNLKTNQLSTIRDSITINDGAQEIYTNTNNLEKLSTFFSDLKESVNTAFNGTTQNKDAAKSAESINGNDLTAILSRGNTQTVQSDKKGKEYSLYTTKAQNQESKFENITKQIKQLINLKQVDDLIQDKELRTIVKGGITNIFKNEKNNKVILEALEKNLADAEKQLKKASSFNQRISAWWDSLGENAIKVQSNDGEIKINKALHDSREALRNDIAKYQKQIKELKKITKECKEISHRFEKSNDKAIDILSNLSFVPTDNTNILTYLTSDKNTQEAITEKTQSLLNSKLEEYQKSLENNKGEIIHRQNEISKQLNAYYSTKNNSNLEDDTKEGILTAIKDGISYQFNLLKNNYNLLSSTQKSFSALFSLNPNNKDLKILCNNFKAQTEGYNSFINIFKSATESIGLEFTVPKELEEITLKEINQKHYTEIIQNLLKEINNENFEEIEIIAQKNQNNPKELLSIHAAIANYLSDPQQTQNVSPDILNKLDELLGTCYNQTNENIPFKSKEGVELTNNHLNSYFNDSFVLKTYKNQEDLQSLITFLNNMQSYYTDNNIQEVINGNEKLISETATIQRKIPTVIDKLQKHIKSDQLSQPAQPAAGTAVGATPPPPDIPGDSEPSSVSDTNGFPPPPPAPLPPTNLGTGVSGSQTAPAAPTAPNAQPAGISTQGLSAPQPGRTALLSQIQQGTTLRKVEPEQKEKQTTSTPTDFAGLKERIDQNMKRRAELQSKSSSQTATQTSMPLKGTSQQNTTNPLLDFDQDFSN